VILKILFLLLMLGSGGFVASRAYLLIARGTLNVKGVTYSRARTPVSYWVELALAITGATLILCTALIWVVGMALGEI